MDSLQAILTRRSVRRYNDTPVTDQQIDLLIQAAVAAPSAHNQQPWHFIVIDDRPTLDQITRIHPYSQMLKQAPLAICVCADLQRQKEPGVDYWIQDCAATTQNILIAANALGLGSCWLGVHPRQQRQQQIAQLLQLPDHVLPFSIIALGLTSETPKIANRDHQKRMHKNHW